MGILIDRSGRDRYSAQDLAQGAGRYGVGVLADALGDDTYERYARGQGYGGACGAGVLIDHGGDARYVANDTDIRNPSAQDPEHNTSLAQGAACGKRRDYRDFLNGSGKGLDRSRADLKELDCRGMVGGVGILLDRAGDDSYFGGVFAQAVAHLYGVGILDDRAGNDTYRGVWYAQSATAHSGISLLTEGGGNDHYESVRHMRVAAAHDYSISLFLEEGGQ